MRNESFAQDQDLVDEIPELHGQRCTSAPAVAANVSINEPCSANCEEKQIPTQPVY